METPSLDGCWHKYHRAEEHGLELNGELERFLDGNPYRFTRKFDPQERAFIVRAYTLKTPNTVRWGVVLGEIVHNLRCALDHPVWQLALLSGVPEPRTRLQFPMELTGPGYWAPKGSRPSVRDDRLQGITEEYRTLIDRCQPYRRGPDARLHALFVLRELSNMDKHRFVHGTEFGIAIPNMLQLLAPNEDAGTIEDATIRPCPLDGDAEIARIIYTCPGPNPHVDVNGELPLDISISSVAMPLREVEAKLVPEIADVLDAAVPFFRAAGAIE